MCYPRGLGYIVECMWCDFTSSMESPQKTPKDKIAIGKIDCGFLDS